MESLRIKIDYLSDIPVLQTANTTRADNNYKCTFCKRDSKVIKYMINHSTGS
jgi:hypothetical protein